MAKSRRSANPGGETDASPAFEQSLAELQQIVIDLEEGALGLEESMQRFEKAIVLLRGCYRILEEAEQKIEILTGMDAQGNPITAPFDPSTNLQQTEQVAGKRRRTGTTEKPADTDQEETEDRLF